MSEFSFPSNTSTKTKFSSLLLANFFNLCFFILSHPLYFSYFIFFSPYLLKLFSFLSPLCITTALLVLAYLTVSPTLVHEDSANPELSKIQVGCLITTYQTVLEKLHKSKVDDCDGDDHGEFRSFVELEAYKIVFDTSNFDIGENPVEENCSKVFEAPVDDVSSHEAGGAPAALEAASDVLEKMQKSKVDDCDGEDDEEFRSFDELEAYKIMFDTPNFDIGEDPVEENCSQVCEAPVDDVSIHEAKSNGTSAPLEAASDVSDDNQVKVAWPGVGRLKEFFEEANWSKNTMGTKEKKEAQVMPPSTQSNKVGGDGKEKTSMRRASKDLGNYKVSVNYDGDEIKSKPMSINSQRVGENLGENYNGMKVVEESPDLGSFGSMRKEKEWRRTLACKLFEERHQNVDGGGEGMDMLWETYDETETDKMMKGKSKSKKGRNAKVGHHYNEDEDDEEEEEEGMDGQLCCLQALKFSAGKMNLGMGRPNLVKISKALKGFGWLHHVTKHSKKGYH